MLLVIRFFSLVKIYRTSVFLSADMFLPKGVNMKSVNIKAFFLIKHCVR